MINPQSGRGMGTKLSGTYVWEFGLGEVSFTAANYTLIGFGTTPIHSGTYKIDGDTVTITVTKILNPIAGAKVGDSFIIKIIDENTLYDVETESYLTRKK